MSEHIFLGTDRNPLSALSMVQMTPAHASTPAEDVPGGVPEGMIGINDWLTAYNDGDSGLGDYGKYLALYNGVANGSIYVAPTDFDLLLTPNSDPKTMDVNEWGTLSPEMQAWAEANPQEFMQSVLAHRNPANNDLLSIGAEGGYNTASMANLRPVNNNVDWSGAQYLDVHDDDGFLGGLLPIALSFIAPGLGTAIGSALGAEGLAASVLGNAVVGGATSGLTGGNVLTGALSGGLGGAMGGLNIAGDYLNVTDPALAKAVNSGITSGAKQLLTTGDIDLGNLAANIALGYGTNVAGGAIGKEFDLTPDQTKAVTGGLGALVRGGDIGDAALGAASGYTGAPISNLYGMYKRYKRASSPAGTTLAGSSPSMANLYQQYLNSKLAGSSPSMANLYQQYLNSKKV